MRKHQHNQILELLETIKQAQTAKLYADCQEGALFLCDIIDGISGEGTQTAAMLVEYCEMLYKVSQGELGEKLLKKKFIKINNSVRVELRPNKIEVVFLPYRAAMFDALETIYLAAAADPACDAYVIPIPYYEINVDETIGASHYDGALFPSYIPITHWEAYDLETRRPDVIFTHQPYDRATNFTIHTDYYHEKLREYCDKVIYVPYFVVGNNVGGLSVFINTLGPLHAHHTILENEAVRQCYIDFYAKAGKEHNITEYLGDLNKKFLALGSPKFDKVINTKPEDCALPESWHSLIHRPDGTRKKIILYNTHWQAWIDGREKYFAKLRHVFDTFRNRDDVVLWWRPHPNCEKNFRTFRPAGLDAYFDIVNEYKQGAWGIYDNTPDLHRAIAWSDAYYGDGSSLVPLYRQTGKHIMMANVEVAPNERRLTNTFYVSKECIWIKATVINLMYKIIRDKKDDVFTEYFFIPDEVVRGSINSRFAEKNGTFYFIPERTDKIIIYSTHDNLLVQIPFNRNVCGIKPNEPAFKFIFFYNDFVYYIPMKYPAIMRLDINTHEIAYFTDWFPVIKNNNSNPEYGWLGEPTLVKNICWMVNPLANAVVAFDMDTGCSTVYIVGEKDNKYTYICFDGENYWLTLLTSRTPIIKWHPDKGILHEYPLIYADTNDRAEYQSVYYCFYAEGQIWFLQAFENHVLKIDVKTNKLSIEEDFEVDCEEPGQAREAYIFQIPQFHDNILYAMKKRNKKNILITYNCITRERHDYTLIPPLDLVVPLFDNVSFHPEGIYTLNDLIHHIQNNPNNEDFVQQGTQSNESVGRRIYHRIKQLL